MHMPTDFCGANSFLILQSDYQGLAEEMGLRRSAVVQRACRIRAYVARLIARSTNAVEAPQEQENAPAADQGEVNAPTAQGQAQANEEE